ncbi:MAG TPA: hypothetical protein VGC56_04180 [Allosphingosinicella sp.]|jgi:hypothetical protein
MTAHQIKSNGYLLSILSVFLLAIPSLKSAKEQPLLLACLIAGAATSILGMVLRWIADKKTQRKIADAQGKGDAALHENGRAASAGR